MTNDPSPKRDVDADQTGIAAGGNVTMTAGGDVVGRDKVVHQHLPPVDEATALDDRQRAAFLNQVRSVAQKRLDQGRKRVIRLDLGLDAVPDAVTQPLDARMPDMPRDRSVRALPAGASIRDVFIREGGEQGGLLILGDPGAGKSTLLLELALALADEADRSRPVPTVVPLSTWQQHRRPLADWLADQLNELYYVPSKIATRWVQNGRILPLLDGLDEIDDLDARAACVIAINKFRRETFSSVVVCSRRLEYEVLADATPSNGRPTPRVVKLELAAAVIIRPLDPDAVRRHLQQAGRPLTGVRAVLKDDPELLELCRSPLMLSMLTLTYHGQPATQLRRGGSPEQRRQQLFHDYVSRGLNRLADEHGESKEGRHADAKRRRMVHWLGALAHNLNRHNQTVFLLERMQPDWLPTRRPTAVAFGFWLIPGLCYGLGLGLFLGSFGLISQLRLGLINGLINGLGLGLLRGLVTGLLLGLINGLIQGRNTGATWVIRLQPAERLTWSWRRALSRWRRALRTKRRVKRMVAVYVLFIVIAVDGGDLGLVLVWLAVGLTVGILGLAAGLESGERAQSIRPNEGIRRSLRHGLWMWGAGPTLGSIVGLLLGLVVGFADGWVDADNPRLKDPPLSTRVLEGLTPGLGFGLICGLILGQFFGLGAVLRYGFLRISLWRYHVAPLRYVRWLEEMVRARLLYRVGGGYEFAHGLLRDYFEKQARPGFDSERRHLTTSAPLP